MEYKKEVCLMIDPRTGAARLVESSEDPEQIVKAFLKQAKKRMACFGPWTSWLSRIGRNGNR